MRQAIAVSSLLASLLTVAGCAPPVYNTYATIGQPTTMQAPLISNVPFEVGNGRVLVLTPEILALAAPTLAGQVDKIDPAAADAAAAGLMRATEYDVVAASFERNLLNGGLTPVSRDAIVNAIADDEVVTQVRALVAAHGTISLGQLAMILAPRANASVALLIRSSLIGFADAPVAVLSADGCNPVRIQPLEVHIDAALVAAEGGDLLWTGNSTLRSGDLLPEPVTFPMGPERAQFSRAYGPIFTLTGQDDGRQCGFTSIAGYFCAEWDQASGGCMHNQTPSFPEAVAYVVDQNVLVLTSEMMSVAQR